MNESRLTALLKKAAERGASDLHITAGTKPFIRVDNKLQRLQDEPVLMPEDTEAIIFSVVDQEHAAILKIKGETDMAFGIKGFGRFRLNAYRQRGSYACAFRLMHPEIPDIETLGLPAVLRDCCYKRDGLVLITGPTGTGKSTTLAAMVQEINKNRAVHVITLEDPIEYLHRHGESMIDQREIGIDSETFGTALRAAMREDPDVIVIGEMRDRETISAALTAAETGHLIITTLHTTSAASSVERIIDVFPPKERDEIRLQLSMVLKTAASQRLIPRADGNGRVAAFEVMQGTPAIRNIIKDNRLIQLKSAIQTGTRDGMQTMDQALGKLVSEGIIKEEDAREFMTDPAEPQPKAVLKW